MHRRGLLTAVGVAVIAAFVTVTAHAQLLASRREVEREYATRWLVMKRESPQVTDARSVTYVECIAGAIIRQLDPEWQDLNWEVVIFDNEAINAFVMPGGKIGIFTGIMKIADTPDALAAVIGHEVAHLTEGHVMARARRQSGSTLGSIVGSAATGLHRSVFDMSASVLFQLPFQRGQESESDIVGLKYMADAGFDPRAALQLWQDMEAASEGRNKPPEWMSTHPREQTRIDDMVPLLVENLKRYNAAQEAGRYPSCYRR